MSAAHVRAALRMRELPPLCKLTLIAVCDAIHSQRLEAGCWTSTATLADTLGVSTRCVWDHLKILTDREILHRTRRYNQSSTLTIGPSFPAVGSNERTAPTRTSRIRALRPRAVDSERTAPTRTLMGSSINPVPTSHTISHLTSDGRCEESPNSGKEVVCVNFQVEEASRELLRWWNAEVVPLDATRLVPLTVVTPAMLRLYAERLRTFPELRRDLPAGLDPIARWRSAPVEFAKLFAADTTMDRAIGGALRETDPERLRMHRRDRAEAEADRLRATRARLSAIGARHRPAPVPVEASHATPVSLRDAMTRMSREDSSSLSWLADTPLQRKVRS